jgi:hypothetical protein
MRPQSSVHTVTAFFWFDFVDLCQLIDICESQPTPKPNGGGVDIVISAMRTLKEISGIEETQEHENFTPDDDVLRD